MWVVFLRKIYEFCNKNQLNCQNLRGLTDKSDRYNSYKYSVKWTEIEVNVGICLGNNQGNF